MNKPAVPTLKIRQAGRDSKTGTSRYTFTLGTFRGTGLTKAEAVELQQMKDALAILDEAHARGLFYYTDKPVFTSCDLYGNYLTESVGA